MIPGMENIGRRERRKRMAFGAVMFLAALGLAITLIVMQVDRLWRLTVALPIFLGGLGFFQARLKTCVVHAARGTCNLDQGNQPVADAGRLTRLRAQAKTVLFLALIFAGLFTAAVTVLPY